MAGQGRTAPDNPPPILPLCATERSRSVGLTVSVPTGRQGPGPTGADDAPVAGRAAVVTAFGAAPAAAPVGHPRVRVTDRRDTQMPDISTGVACSDSVVPSRAGPARGCGCRGSGRAVKEAREPGPSSHPVAVPGPPRPARYRATARTRPGSSVRAPWREILRCRPASGGLRPGRARKNFLPLARVPVLRRCGALGRAGAFWGSRSVGGGVRPRSFGRCSARWIAGVSLPGRAGPGAADRFEQGECARDGESGAGSGAGLAAGHRPALPHGQEPGVAGQSVGGRGRPVPDDRRPPGCTKAQPLRADGQ